MRGWLVRKLHDRKHFWPSGLSFPQLYWQGQHLSLPKDTVPSTLTRITANNLPKLHPSPSVQGFLHTAAERSHGWGFSTTVHQAVMARGPAAEH